MSLPSLQDFENVLKNILSPDNQTRTQAEKYFDQAKTQPEYCILSLIQLMKQSQHVEIRSLACVLLRKCLTDTDQQMYKALNERVRENVKTQLISALAEEKVDAIRSKMVYAVSGFVAGLIEKGQYPDLIPTMFTWIERNSPTHRESALGIFNQLATHLMNKGLAPYVDTLKNALRACLDDVQNHKVRLAALEATSSVVLVLEKQNRAKFQELIPNMLKVLASTLTGGDINASSGVIESLIEIAISHPSFFKQHATQIINAMFTIAKTKNLDDSVRHLAMEFMVSMAETAPTLTSKIPQFVDNLFPLSMDMMLDIEDDEEWENSYEDEDLELTNYDVGLESLDRIALSLGGKLVQPVAFRYIPQFLNTSNWKHKHTGLMAIAQTAEGCITQYQPHLKSLIGMALAHFSDPHPRVRYAAIHCAAQLSTDFTGQIQSQFHSQVVPCLLSAMDDKVSRVQSHAATAVVNFVEECELQYLEPYIDKLVGKLLSLLRNGKRFVQEQSLSAISAIADCAEATFSKYYDAVIPFLKEILLKATGKQDRMLRARAIECVSLVGVAVGKQKFLPDSRQVMELLHKTQQSQMDPDDPQAQHLLQAWTRIAKCLGEDFLPYLAFVMPPLLKAAEQQPEVIVTDADDDTHHEDEGMESVTLNIKGVGEKRISIKTSALEEKSLACSMLCSYAMDLKEGFYTYVEQVAKIMVPLLKFAYLEEIRETAGHIMPHLLKSVKLAVEKKMAEPSMVKKLLDFILNTLSDALRIEPEVKTATILAESLKDCLLVTSNDILSQQQVESITLIIKTAILDSIKRRRELETDFEQEEDEEEQDRINDDQVYEEEFLSTLVDLVGNLMKTQALFVPYFEKQLWPIYTALLDPKLSDEEHRLAICVFCDFIEHGRGAAIKYSAEITSTFLNYSTSPDADVRQAAVYGLGALAQYGEAPFNSVIKDAIQKLKIVITHPNAKEETNAAATTNAVSALYKVVQYRKDVDGVNINELLGIWLNALPVSGDTIESKIVHQNLVDLITQNNPVVLGQGNSNVPHIIKIFATVLHSENASDQCQTKMVQILRTMQQQLPPQLLQQAWSKLSQKEQSNLKTAISNHQTNSPK